MITMENKVQSNWEFETIYKHALDIIMIIDQNRLVRFSTPSFKKTTGYSPEELKDIFDIVQPDERENLMERHRNVILTQQPSKSEYRIITRSGHIKYFECRTMPVESQDNLTVVTVRDITERKNMEIELQNRKDRYKLLQNSLKNFSQDLSSVMKVSDLKERLIHEINTVLPDSQPAILQFNKENQIIEEAHFLEFQPDLQNFPVGKIVNVNDKVLIKVGERTSHAYILILNAQSIEEEMDSIWLETIVYYANMVFESLDVIENLMNQLEAAMQSSQTPLWILRLLFNLSEKERLHLSSDLHDTVLQDQIDLYRRMESLLHRHEFDNEIKALLKGIEQGLLDTIHQIRMTCNELRPPLLRELGLERALENLFEYTQVSSTFKIYFSTDNTSSLQLNEEQTIGIYRIVQELINNATKHSKASKIHLHISAREDKMMFEYSDDGVGFELDKLKPSFNNMGLTSIKQRVQSLSGNVEFYSKPNCGLKVTMQIPCTGIGDKKI